MTGSAAYEGSTAEAMLRARLDTPLPVRLELGTLDMVLAQAAVPDPRLRLDAEQFSQRLGAVVGDASPLVVRPGSEETPLLAQFEQQPEPRRSIGFSAPSAEQITGAQPAVGRLSRAPTRAPEHGSLTGVARADRPYTAIRGTQYDLPRTTSRRGGFLIAAVVIVVLAIAAGVVWKLGVFKSSHAVPNLVGQTTKQASSAIASDGFTFGMHDVNSATWPDQRDRQPDAQGRHLGQVGLRDQRERLQGSRHGDVVPIAGG